MDKNLEAELKQITRLPNERLARVRALSLAEQSVVLQELSSHAQQALLSQLKISEIVDIVDHMDPRQAENILARIKDQKRRLKIIQKVKGEAREKNRILLTLPPQGYY